MEEPRARVAAIKARTGGKLPVVVGFGIRTPGAARAVASFADGVVVQGAAAGLRITADRRNEKLGYKIREAQVQKVPIMAVIGEREAADGTVAPRIGGNNEPAVALDAFVARVVEEARMPGGAS